MKIDFKKALPHIIAIAAFAIIALLYCSPVLEGKKVEQHDMVQANGMTKEATDFYAATKEAPLWSNSMFGGMPTFVTFTGPSSNHIAYLNKIFTLWLPEPANMLFLAMLGMYFLLCVMGMKNWVSGLGAVAYGFSSYNIIIIVVGHITKMMCMSYMAPVLAGIWLVIQGRYLLGGIITALMIALLINNNHLQVTYYMMIMIACFAIAAAIYYIKQKQLAQLAKAGAVLLIAAALGILPGSELWMVQKDYAQYTMRGSQSELTAAPDTAKVSKTAQTKKDGLDIEYAYRWSYGKYETFTFLIPRLVGGSNNEKISETSKAAELISERGQDGESFSKNAPLYFGPQPGTSGPVYFGAIICFLFVLSFFTVKSWHKWWLLAATLIGIVMSWGNNFMVVNEFLFNHLPLYNKFRAPTIILIIPQLTFVVLGCWALNEVISKKFTKEELLQKLKWAFYITAGLTFLIGVVGSFMGDFSAATDKQIFGDNKDLLTAFRADRASALRMDAFRSLLFILVAAAVLWAYIKDKLKWMPVVAIIGLAVIIDLFMVDKRYLDNEKFAEQDQIEANYRFTPADESILKDKDPNYKVLNLAGDPFNDAITSYAHKSVGGYSPAKLWIYQDLIENQIYNNIQNIGAKLQAGGTMESFDSAMMNNPVLNMLNTKYIITNDKAPALFNKYACGNAWFVNTISWANNANEEMKALTDFNPATTAVIDKRFEKTVGALQPSKDSTASVKLTKYGLNEMKYESNNPKDGLAVFSEIWYPGGWKAFIDGKETPLIRANYALRSLVVPAGKHTIEMKFEPEVFFKAKKISNITSYLLILLTVAIVLWELLRKKKGASVTEPVKE